MFRTSDASAEELFRSLDRIMRTPPHSFTESALTRECIERVNRATRERTQAQRRAVIFSALD